MTEEIKKTMLTKQTEITSAIGTTDEQLVPNLVYIDGAF
jgi:hypothetical protein